MYSGPTRICDVSYIVKDIMIFEKFKCYIKDFVVLGQYEFFIKFNTTTRSRRAHGRLTLMLHSWADLRTDHQLEGHTSTVA